MAAAPITLLDEQVPVLPHTGEMVTLLLVLKVLRESLYWNNINDNGRQSVWRHDSTKVFTGAVYSISKIQIKNQFEINK